MKIPKINSIREFLTELNAENVIKSQVRKNNSVVYGAQAIKKHIGPLARPTNDYDILTKNPKKSARMLEKSLDSQAGSDMYYTKPAVHPGTHKVKGKGPDRKKGTWDDYEVADFTKPKRRHKTVRYDGIRYVTIPEIVQDKKRSIADPQYSYRHEKDRNDLKRINTAIKLGLIRNTKLFRVTKKMKNINEPFKLRRFEKPSLEPYNKKKQGIDIYEVHEDESGNTTEKKIKPFSKLKKFAGKIKSKYKEYKAKEPERRAAKLEKAKYELELQKIREKKAMSYTIVQQQKLNLAKQRNQVYLSRQSILGGSVPAKAPSPWMPPPKSGFGSSRPKSRSKTKTKKKSKAKRR